MSGCAKALGKQLKADPHGPTFKSPWILSKRLSCVPAARSLVSSGRAESLPVLGLDLLHSTALLRSQSQGYRSPSAERASSGFPPPPLELVLLSLHTLHPWLSGKLELAPDLGVSLMPVSYLSSVPVGSYPRMLLSPLPFLLLSR